MSAIDDTAAATAMETDTAASSSPVSPSGTTAKYDAKRADRDAKVAVHTARMHARLAALESRNRARAATNVIKEGDVLIAYESHLVMSPLRVSRGAIFNNRYGAFHHVDMLGLSWGSKVRSRSGAGGWIILMPVTPELWTRALTHRTQILYFADIAFVTHQLMLAPGSVVIESGTGSGSLSVSIARSVKPHGHCHTFEFNIERVQKARQDFDFLSLTLLLTVHHRDVCALGFPMIEGGVDAVFLDLPAPWTVLESAQATMRHGARLASFSPCIEQVQRVCERLRSLEFNDIRTHEVLLQEHEVIDLKLDVVPPTGFATSMKKRTHHPAASRGSDAKRSKGSDGRASPTATDGTAAARSPSPPAVDAVARYPASLRGFALARGHTGYLTFATRIRS